MLSSIKKWVQDVSVDLAPPTPSASSTSLAHQSSTSSSSYSTSLPKSSQNSNSSFLINQRQQYNYNGRLSNSSASSSSAAVTGTAMTRLSRPISMDSVPSPRSSRNSAFSIPPIPSPVELDLSHLNREEQEHIANVLKRARFVDEQQSTSTPQPPAASNPTSIMVAPSASILSASSSSSTTTSPNTTTPSSPTTSLPSDPSKKHGQDDQNDNHADNEIDEEDQVVLPEQASITVHRCQASNKGKQSNESLYLNTRDGSTVNEKITSYSSFANVTGEWNSDPLQFVDHDEDKIYDNILKMNEEPIKENIFFEELSPSPSTSSSSQFVHRSLEKNIIKNNEHQEDEQRHQLNSSLIERASTAAANEFSTNTCATRSSNLTEIDESDFFYQDPSPYSTVIDHHSVSDQTKQSAQPSYKIDEFIDEDDNDERDHVKELEQTIANLSRHFPLSTALQIDSNERNQIVSGNIQQSPSLSAAKIDADSILEMEIESPSTDDCFIQSPSITSMQSPKHQVNIPISVPISITHRHGSLSRSSGVRENLKSLLSTPFESADYRPLQRTYSTTSKPTIIMHRQRRNLPSLPSTTNHLQLRRANSESRFCLPAVTPSLILPNSNMDDEFDLLEIDMKDPTGSVNRTARSKTESELAKRVARLDTSNERALFYQNPSADEVSISLRHGKHLKDQTTNTPPISAFGFGSVKSKKKLKKKGSVSPVHSNQIPCSTNQFVEPKDLPSPTTNTPKIAILSNASTTSRASSTSTKLQKSTSTEISYPFPVSKLILIRDNLSPSRQTEDDLGFRITGGHSIANCVEVTARIEKINIHHKNYSILRNAVEQGDEVLEVAGVPLRGKSALFVKNLMNSIENEFEIVVRSQNVVMNKNVSTTNLTKVDSVKKSNNENSVRNMLTVVDPNTGPRRHSMDTSQLTPAQTSNASVVKSQSTIMNSAETTNETKDLAEESHLPTMTRKKSVSSKERLFSVESLRRTASTKSVEQNKKTVEISRQTSDNQSRKSFSISSRQESVNKDDERNNNGSTMKTTTSIVVNDVENVKNLDEPANLSQNLTTRRIYEHRNSLFPNDPGLNGAGSNLSIDRRNSNESDESDNLSQYFRSPQSRKSSLFAPADNSTSSDPLQGSNSTGLNDETVAIASHRLQSFLQTSNGNNNDRTRTLSIDANKSVSNRDRKSFSSTSSFKFLKKKTKSGDLLAPPGDLPENSYVGDIEIQISHNSEREQLVIRIVQAKNLIAKDTNGYSDPFVKVYLLPGRDQENKRRTKHVPRSLNPVWDHTVIYGHVHREELQYKMLEFTVWDYDRFKANDFLGQVTINLKDDNVINERPRWYRLQAYRSRDETNNRGSSPGLCKTNSIESKSSSNSTVNKNSINVQSRSTQRL